MKISQLINHCLYNPQSGYYRTKNPLGSDGDFITAPEISSLFGEVMALYLLNIYAHDDRKFSLVEMGAGRGLWFYDICATITKLAHKNHDIAIKFLANVDFNIIEINAELQKIQQKKLSGYAINWHENFEDFLNHRRFLSDKIYFISNELFDCFAIDQYVKTAQGWQERLVDGVVFDQAAMLTYSDDRRFVLRDFDAKIHEFVIENIGEANDRRANVGAVFEYCQGARDLMESLCRALVEFGGIAVNIDYGYGLYDFGNSLQVVKNHQKIDFLQGFNSGDITAHVDFVALEKIVKHHHLNMSLITQREFLLSLGLEKRVANYQNNLHFYDYKTQLAVNRLIDPNQMGELFKVQIIWR